MVAFYKYFFIADQMCFMIFGKLTNSTWKILKLGWKSPGIFFIQNSMGTLYWIKHVCFCDV